MAAIPGSGIATPPVTARANDDHAITQIRQMGGPSPSISQRACPHRRQRLDRLARPLHPILHQHGRSVRTPVSQMSRRTSGAPDGGIAAPTGLAAAPDCENGRMDAEPTTLTVDELLLRPWRPDDATEVFEICQDPEIARWVTIPQPFMRADADAFIEAALEMWRDGTGAPFAIVDSADRSAVGGGHPLRAGRSPGHLRPLACTRCARSRRRHSGAPARRRLDVRDDGGHPPRRFIMVGNEPSNRMVERAGFQREGVARAWDLHHGGVPVDCVVFSRIRGD